MGAFEYTAVDPSGKEKKGVIEGDTPRRVRQALRERDLLPLSINEIAEKETSKKQIFPARRALSANDLAIITRQIATLVHSGIPLEEALTAVGEQNDKPRIKSVIMGVRAKVMEGHWRVREYRPGTTRPDHGTDRAQRFLARLRSVRAHSDRRFGVGCSSRASAPGPTPEVSHFLAPVAGGWKARARSQYRPIHPHLQHPDR
jgi:hypothetical protein